MAFPIGIAIGGVIEAIKLGMEIVEARNNDTLTQAEFDAKWAAMQAKFKAADDAWVASKKARGQP